MQARGVRWAKQATVIQLCGRGGRNGDSSYVIGALTGMRVSRDGVIKVLSTCCAIALQTRALDMTNANELINL